LRDGYLVELFTQMLSAFVYIELEVEIKIITFISNK